MPDLQPSAYLIIAVSLVVSVFLLIMATKLFVRARAGEAIIRSGIGGRMIATQGLLPVIPQMHTYQLLTMGMRQVQLDTREAKHYKSKDDFHYQALLTLQFSISTDQAQIAHLLENYSVDQLNDSDTLSKLILRPLGESLASIIQKHRIHELFQAPEVIKRSLEEALSKHLSGFHHLQIIIEYMGPVPDALAEAARQQRP